MMYIIENYIDWFDKVLPPDNLPVFQIHDTVTFYREKDNLAVSKDYWILPPLEKLHALHLPLEMVGFMIEMKFKY